VINTATNTVIATVKGGLPFAVVITPDGSRAYVGNNQSTFISAIDTATNTVIGTVENVFQPEGLSFTPDGSRLYAAANSNHVSVIDTRERIAPRERLAN
jgi:YVTN family beta-propeller protein